MEYNQPVLYSHFKSKDAIVAAVAVQGFAELAGHLRAASRAPARRPGYAADAAGAPAAIGRAYRTFAVRRRALYDAMFNQAVDLPFTTPAVPAALHAGFDELGAVLDPYRDDDAGLLAEAFRAALHGLATPTRGGRLPAEAGDRRPDLLAARFAGRRG